MSKYKKCLLSSLGLIFVVVLFLPYAGSSFANEDRAKPDLRKLSNNGTELIYGAWRFTEWNTNKAVFDLSLKSNKPLTLNYGTDGYNGYDRAEFKITEDQRGIRSVYLSLGRAIMKEDFLCLEQCLVAVKFDDEPYNQLAAYYDSQHKTVCMRMSGTCMTGVGENSVLMINSNGMIEKMIAESLTMTVAIDFYQNPYTAARESHEITFLVKGLDIPNLIDDYNNKR